MTADDIAGFIPEIQFSEEDVRAALEEGFDWLADKFHSDHWKLTERQSRMYGAPTTQLLSSVWSNLARFLPGWLSSMCETTPGLAGFIFASALIVGPKVAKQVSISRAAKGKVQTIDGSSPARPGRPVAAPKPNGAVGSISGMDEPLPFSPETTY